uniref:Uncharacterized protein n=1 Tax=Cacopsylla melanoneura TaxID=428564 RepID=A0A8D8XSL5_9HEMI
MVVLVGSGTGTLDDDDGSDSSVTFSSAFPAALSLLSPLASFSPSPFFSSSSPPPPNKLSSSCSTSSITLVEADGVLVPLTVARALVLLCCCLVPGVVAARPVLFNTYGRRGPGELVDAGVIWPAVLLVGGLGFGVVSLIRLDRMVCFSLRGSGGVTVAAAGVDC